MAKVATQTINGKAFEYALLNEFLERLKLSTTVSVVDNDPFKTAKKCFLSFEEKKACHRIQTYQTIKLIKIPNFTLQLKSHDED